MGIILNGKAGPDYLGYEVKHYSVTNLRLFRINSFHERTGLTLVLKELYKGACLYSTQIHNSKPESAGKYKITREPHGDIVCFRTEKGHACECLAF